MWKFVNVGLDLSKNVALNRWKGRNGFIWPIQLVSIWFYLDWNNFVAPWHALFAFVFLWSEILIPASQAMPSYLAYSFHINLV